MARTPIDEAIRLLKDNGASVVRSTGHGSLWEIGGKRMTIPDKRVSTRTERHILETAKKLILHSSPKTAVSIATNPRELVGSVRCAAHGHETVVRAILLPRQPPVFGGDAEHCRRCGSRIVWRSWETQETTDLAAAVDQAARALDPAAAPAAPEPDIDNGNVTGYAPEHAENAAEPISTPESSDPEPEAVTGQVLRLFPETHEPPQAEGRAGFMRYVATAAYDYGRPFRSDEVAASTGVKLTTVRPALLRMLEIGLLTQSKAPARSTTGGAPAVVWDVVPGQAREAFIAAAVAANTTSGRLKILAESASAPAAPAAEPEPEPTLPVVKTSSLVARVAEILAGDLREGLATTVGQVRQRFGVDIETANLAISLLVGAGFMAARPNTTPILYRVVDEDRREAAVAAARSYDALVTGTPTRIDLAPQAEIELAPSLALATPEPPVVAPVPSAAPANADAARALRDLVAAIDMQAERLAAMAAASEASDPALARRAAAYGRLVKRLDHLDPGLAKRLLGDEYVTP